jgi:hypothetical protein
MGMIGDTGFTGATGATGLKGMAGNPETAGFTGKIATAAAG